MNPIESIENASALDAPIEKVGKVAANLIPQGPVKDLLCGTWLGHPLHPLLTDVAIGLWTGSVAIDFLGGKNGRGAADKLLALGTLSAIPTAASGLSDWIDTYGDERRVGFVHAVGNLAATTLFATSYLARKRGKRGLGVALSLAGTSAMTAAGFLGGHMSYRLGAGVDHTRFAKTVGDWTPVTALADLPDRTPTLVSPGGADILIYRDGGKICALADHCSHRAGPLHEGKVDPDGRTVTCPWHASEFDLESGEVVRGPAVAGQPAYETRIVGDQVEVKLR
jgi:nitrite reductase/ring-hydroxylating ferredoxin subunit/uncharacterized membrane protein